MAVAVRAAQGALYLGIASALALSGCRSKNPEPVEMHANFPENTDLVTEDQEAETENADGELRPPRPVSSYYRGPDAPWANATEAERRAANSAVRGMVDQETETIRETAFSEDLPDAMLIDELQTVYFGFDSAALSESAQTAIEQNAEYLTGRPDIMVILRGHTDDRGTEEYNVALGSRRAQSVREALILEGIDPGRLSTVSFGKTMPIVEGENESARSKNRRVEFFVYESE